VDTGATCRSNSGEAIRLLGPCDPVDLYQGEVLFTYYQVLKANQDKGANGWLEQSLTWLMDVANKVPSEYLESFLKRNPVNKAILDKAETLGIDIPTL
jgi:uncharacterized membrane-anchored protein